MRYETGQLMSGARECTKMLKIKGYVVAAFLILPLMVAGCSPARNASYRLLYEIGSVRVKVHGQYIYVPQDGNEGAHEARVSSVKVAPDNETFISGDYVGVIKQWKLCNGKCIRETRTPNGEAVRAMEFSQDGQFLVVVSGYSGDQCHLIVLSAKSLTPLHVYAIERGCQALAVSHDGVMIAIGTRVLDGASPVRIDGKSVRILEMPDAREMTLTGNPEHLFVLTHKGLECRSWEGGKLLYSRTFAPVPANIAGYSERCAAGWGSYEGTGRVAIVGCEAGEKVEFLKGSVANVYAIAAASAVHRVVTLDWDGTVSVWNIEAGELCQELPMPYSVGKFPDKVAISSDGKYIIRGTRGHSALGRNGDLCVYRCGA